jgi:hypothetical protein
MTQLKHIIILVITLLALGLTAKAQSTARQPYDGAMHTYTCNGISVGAAYTFYMAAHADGSGIYDDGLTGEFDILNATGVVGGDGLASTQIQWNNGASQHIYYLWLEATIPGGCSNNIHIQITPQPNHFDLLSENVPVTNTRSCPATASTDGFNSNSELYSAGSTMLQFNVVRHGGTRDWSFIPVLSVDPDLSLGKVIITIRGNNSGVVSAVANRYAINGLDNEVLVTVSIENSPGNTRDVKLQVTDQKESSTNLSDSDPANDAVIHTIEVMPLINGMGGV